MLGTLDECPYGYISLGNLHVGIKSIGLSTNRQIRHDNQHASINLTMLSLEENKNSSKSLAKPTDWLVLGIDTINGN